MPRLAMAEGYVLRFTECGPSIPDELLSARDRGDVVFLCGAGVSMPAGLPSFAGLTKRVLDELGVSPEHEAWRAVGPADGQGPAVPFDRAFDLLERDYGSAEVKRQVEGALQPTTPERGHHAVVARLSTNAVGRPRVVTTNFDRLFHDVETLACLRAWTPRAFPDLSLTEDWDGVVHLHGAVGDPGGNLVLSEGAFGDAYLASGYAAQFVKALLERHAVVLLGYRAEDPPMRYLLKGLQQQGADRHRLYAFDGGEPEAVARSWNDRGARAIAYQGGHEVLWETLERWAERADDPAAWRRAVAARAAAGPRALRPFERGQVVHLVRSTEGARTFAEARPAPGAEWLCVFDRRRRLADPSKCLFGEKADVDPLALYGLDDDPSRRDGDSLIGISDADHELAWREGDEVPTAPLRLTEHHPYGERALPQRLLHLTWWLLGRLEDPASAWWLARQSGLHADMRAALRRELRFGRLAEPARRAVEYALAAATSFDDSLELYRLGQRVTRDGWTPPILEAFARALRPHLRLQAAHDATDVCPPEGGWGEVAGQVARYDVTLRELGHDRLQVQDDDLHAVCRVMSDRLRLFVWTAQDVGAGRFHLAAFASDDRPGAPRFDRVGAWVRWFAGLLDRLADRDPGTCRAEVASWPADEPLIFDRLRLHVWRRADVFPAPELSRAVGAMSARRLWEDRHRRDLLFLLSQRWDDLNDAARAHIEAVLLAGPPNLPDDAEGRRLSAQLSAQRLGWLEGRGCALSAEARRALADLLRNIPNWNDEWIASAADDGGVWGGAIGIDTDPGDLAALPLADIAGAAERRSITSLPDLRENRPFEGLVRSRPGRALAALRRADDNGDCRVTLWRTLLNAWPEDASPRADLLLMATLITLPDKQLGDLRHHLSRVFDVVLPRLYERDPSRALTVLDAIIGAFECLGGEVLDAQAGSVMEKGVERALPPYAIDVTINRPFGWIAEFLLRRLADAKPAAGAEPPAALMERMDRILGVDGHAGGHAAVIFCRDLPWLRHVAPKWTERALEPLFEASHRLAEAAWTGLLSGPRVCESTVRRLAPAFLRLFPWPQEWSTDKSTQERAAQWLVLAARSVADRPAPLTHDQARVALRVMTEEMRCEAIDSLKWHGRDDPSAWEAFVVPFVACAWPAEQSLRTASTTQAFVNLAIDAGMAFPMVVEAIRPRLAPRLDPRHILWQFLDDATAEGEGPARRHPQATVILLNACLRDERPIGPIHGDDVLTVVAEVAPGLVRSREYRALAYKIGRE